MVHGSQVVDPELSSHSPQCMGSTHRGEFTGKVAVSRGHDRWGSGFPGISGSPRSSVGTILLDGCDGINSSPGSVVETLRAILVAMDLPTTMRRAAPARPPPPEALELRPQPAPAYLRRFRTFPSLPGEWPVPAPVSAAALAHSLGKVQGHTPWRSSNLPAPRTLTVPLPLGREGRRFIGTSRLARL